MPRKFKRVKKAGKLSAKSYNDIASTVEDLDYAAVEVRGLQTSRIGGGFRADLSPGRSIVGSPGIWIKLTSTYQGGPGAKYAFQQELEQSAGTLADNPDGAVSADPVWAYELDGNQTCQSGDLCRAWLSADGSFYWFLAPARVVSASNTIFVGAFTTGHDAQGNPYPPPPYFSGSVSVLRVDEGAGLRLTGSGPGGASLALVGASRWVAGVISAGAIDDLQYLGVGGKAADYLRVLADRIGGVVSGNDVCITSDPVAQGNISFGGMLRFFADLSTTQGSLELLRLQKGTGPFGSNIVQASNSVFAVSNAPGGHSGFGVSGSFTSGDGKTVTVVGGIITGIA